MLFFRSSLGLWKKVWKLCEKPIELLPPGLFPFYFWRPRLGAGRKAAWDGCGEKGFFEGLFFLSVTFGIMVGFRVSVGSGGHQWSRFGVGFAFVGATQ